MNDPHSNALKQSLKDVNGVEREFSLALTDLLPLIEGEELDRNFPPANPAAVQIAGGLIRNAWRNS